MSTRKKSIKKAADSDLSFEQAIARLETIVADMEAAELPLDEVLERYAEGTRLVKFCGHKLEEAEKKIELLTKKQDGSMGLAPLDDDQSADDDDDTTDRLESSSRRTADDEENVGDLF